MLEMMLRDEVFRARVPLPDTDILDLKAMAVEKFHATSAHSPDEQPAVIPDDNPVAGDYCRPTMHGGLASSLRKRWRPYRSLAWTPSARRPLLQHDSPLRIRAQGCMCSCGHCPGRVESGMFGGSHGGVTKLSGHLALPCVRFWRRARDVHASASLPASGAAAMRLI